jgi:hypothetical protein
VSSCTVWLKTLNLALMGGTPQYIYLFLVVFVLPLFLLSFYFPVLLLCFIFRDKKGTSAQVWGCAMSHASSSLNPRLAFSMQLHIGDNVQIKFGGTGDTSTHFVMFEKKNKKNCMFMLS